MAVKARSGSGSGVVGARWLAAAVAIVLAWGGAARAANVVTQNLDEAAAARIQRVAFLPFVRVGPVGEDGKMAVCPIDRRSHQACPIDAAAEAELSRALGQLLPQGTEVVWTSQEEINAARQRVKDGGGAALPYTGAFQIATGYELGVDAILFGFIHGYRDRAGNALASGQPASVGFCLHLVDLQSLTVVWSFSYFDEQQPLFANLLDLPLFLKRGCKWISAYEMSQEAAVLVNQNLPWRRGKK